MLAVRSLLPVRVPLAAYATLLVALAAIVSLQVADAVGHSTITYNDGELIDFACFYAGGSLLCEPTRPNVYDPSVFNAALHSMFKISSRTSAHSFLYPPYAAAIYSVLSYLRFQYAWLLWTVASIAAVAAALRAISGKEYPSVVLLAALAVAGCLPAYFNFRVGQNGALLMLGAALWFAAARSKRHYRAGLAAAIMLFKPQFAPLFIIAGAITGRWKFLAGLATGCAALAAMCLPVGGVELVSKFVSGIISAGIHKAYFDPNVMDNICSLLIEPGSLPYSTAMHAAALVFAVVCVLVACLWFFVHRRREDTFDLCAAITMWCAVAFSVHSYDYDYLIAAIASIVAWQATRSITGSAATAMRALILASPLLSWSAFAAAGFAALLSSQHVMQASLLAFTLILFHPCLLIVLAQTLIAVVLLFRP